ncbi:ArnT family glycosyltransferase [Prochlorococcus marinus]|uniref:4-amino-4-deoxy-L-arabinose transferase n=1 Tax=Prochlorococcus marinus XMU1408 TaxID=2213228 RepID=A0A318R4F2_PROMR|nr:glycosyltransferase family 39 protein [Prochlorococcus marinus]MBW3041915.1 4-amino-4-deoxy-L-arabinose transferase [Prochlorococcus marinus str. XMU1408]PYE03044.1 4-amino-4-deoxy-L-arabinose transferase [Prochlorococcus marinus XMU1408]
MKKIENNPLIYRNNKLGIFNLFLRHQGIFVTLLFILSFVLLYFSIDFSTQSLVAHDEGLYARRSRLVEESSNWFSPTFSSVHHKTLGSYWLIALSIRLFGFSELALRLPSILSSFICLFISYLIACKVTNKKSALISVFSLASMPLWIQYSRYASPDLPFVLCILLVIFFFLSFLDSNKYIYKYFYIFNSGLFFTSAFFIRSYMAFVPLIGLSPFLLFHLIRSKNIFKYIFSFGTLFGSIPTLLNLYFSYKKYGLSGITTLFDFAKKQAIGGFDLNNYIFTPINFLYLTFPIGFLFILLIVFTRSTKSQKYPLLVYFYPISSVLILLCMSTSYPHYYLFLLPSLSILFSVKLNYEDFRFSLSAYFIKYLLFFICILIISILFSFLLFLKDSLIEYSYGNLFIVYLLPLILILSYISSIYILLIDKNYKTQLQNFFYTVAIPQVISLSFLFNFGILGNPNYRIKSFLNDVSVSSIINSNTIYLLNVESKIQTLLSYYLPSSKIINQNHDFSEYKYIITSNTSDFETFNDNIIFKSISRFPNHVLLINISK